jgi:acyl-coenzyme A synthetase/AMP-(fatty) acid ligase
VVVPRPGAGFDPAELLAWVAERVAPHKRLRAIRFADAIPRTPSGKLLRRALRDADRDRARRDDPRRAPVGSG